MFKHTITVLILLSGLLHGNKSFTIRLDKTTTIESSLNSFIETGAMNFGYWEPGSTIFDPNYHIRVNSGSVSLNSSLGSITLTLNATFFMDTILGAALGFDHSANVSFSVTGTPEISYDEIDDICILSLNNVNINVNTWPDWANDFLGISILLAGFWDDLRFMNLVEFYPELSPYYFQSDAPELTVTDDALLISVYLNDEIIVSNKSNSEPADFIEGNISLQNIDTPALTQLNKPSPSSVFARSNDNYIATTHSQIIDNEVHLTWTNDIDHKLTTVQFPMGLDYFEDGLSAWFDNQDQIEITSNLTGATINLHDPWYYDETAQTQPDEFRPLTEMTEDGTCNVFLNQNENFYDNLPIYSLRAPRYYADTERIYEFSEWSGTDIDFGDGATSTIDRETDVVFKSAGASIQANYDLIEAGDMVIIDSEMNIIPAGAEISMPAGSQINLIDPTRFAGTELNKIVLKGAPDVSGNPVQWDGIVIDNDYTGDYLEHLSIQNVSTAIEIHNWNNLDFNEIHISDAGIGMSNHDLGNYLTVYSSEFTDIREAAIYDEVIEIGNWDINNCTFTGSSSFPSAKGIYFEGENYDFDIELEYINISNCTFSEFATAIRYEGNEETLSEGMSDLSITLSNNTIRDCHDSGIWLEGGFLLFSHHNLIHNCGIGYYVKHMMVEAIEEFRFYVIQNETIVGNDIGMSAVEYESTRLPSGVTTLVNACIFYGNDIGLQGNGFVSANGNVFYDNASQDFTGVSSTYSGNNTVDEDPLFVNPVNDDYHIQSGSPCIDAGVIDFDGDGETWETDIDDQDPDGTRMDIGAYYYIDYVGVTVENHAWWNIVGLPVTVNNTQVNTVFPSAVEGSCYQYDTGFQQTETLLTGEGYWLRFSESGSTNITGSVITSLDVPLFFGWNLISGISEEVSLDQIIDDDGLIIHGSFYEFNAGFQPVTTMTPGKGYWVRANDTGTITITNTAQTSGEFVNLMENANWVKFKNNKGKEKKVYFGVNVPEENQLSYTLPPLPPDEVMEQNFMDTRFANGKTYTEDVGTIEVRNTDYPLTVEYGILNDNGEWEISSNAPKRIHGDEEYGDIGRVKLNRTGTIVVEHPIESFTIRKTSTNNLPIEFALKQNYPNPFNPITTIVYDVPKESHITLTVYDLMGRVVKELVSDRINAGTHHIIWNGTDAYGQSVASGMYLYRLKSDNYIKTKKLVMLK